MKEYNALLLGYTISHNGFIKNPNPSNWNLILTIVILRNLPNQINDFFQVR
jgi:hypothetical protein